MNFETWMITVPKEITEDCLWKVEAYRLSLFTAELSWNDTTKLAGDRRTWDLSGQLYRAVGSLDANISEGYSRGSGRDRARFYEYALGSARESRGWYYKARHVLGETVLKHRLALITHIIRLLLPMIRDQRTSSSFLHEETTAYEANTTYADPEMELSIEVADLSELLTQIPVA